MERDRFTWPRSVLAAGCLAVASCRGMQSTLDPAGRDAERITSLFSWMAGGAVVIWLAVVGFGLLAVVGRTREHSPRSARLIIFVGGVAFPTVVLAVLLLYGLSMLPRVLALPTEDGLKIAVSGERWWWRVRYMHPDGTWIESANEIRLPVGHRTEFILDSPDVIHSFWIPPLGGKMDMIPGRITRLALEPTRTGRFRGQCAEYCGTSHALMAFDVEVMEPAAFDAWLDAQRQPAVPPAGADEASGGAAFAANGCGACHAIRGTDADGTVGPDLTHVGSRMSLAAGTLPNDPAALTRWIRHAPTVKPDARMPPFDMLPPEQIRALAAYLRGLQ